MKTLHFIREPGFVYDLFFPFMLHFSMDVFLERYLDDDNREAEMAYHNGVCSEYEDIPADLLPFFHLKDGHKSLMTMYYFDKRPDNFLTTYQLSDVQQALRNVDEVVEKMLLFYFPDVDEATRAACKQSPVECSRLIKNSTYSDALKSRLYAFFLEPEATVQILINELEDKGLRLARRYEREAKRLERLQNELDIDDLAERLRECHEVRIDLEPFSDIYITFGLLNKGLISATYYKNEALLFLGAAYTESLDDMRFRGNQLNWNAIGTAFSEKNRTDILEMIAKKGEVTLREVQEAFGFTPTNTYYHMTLLSKAGLLKTRNQGRTVLYSLNKSFFHLIREALGRYAE